MLLLHMASESMLAVRHRQSYLRLLNASRIPNTGSRGRVICEPEMSMVAAAADGRPEHAGARQHVRLHIFHVCSTAATSTAAAAALTAAAACATAAAALAAEAGSCPQAAGRLWTSCGWQPNRHHAAAPLCCPSSGTLIRSYASWCYRSCVAACLVNMPLPLRWHKLL